MENDFHVVRVDGARAVLDTLQLSAYDRTAANEAGAIEQRLGIVVANGGHEISPRSSNASHR